MYGLKNIKCGGKNMEENQVYYDESGDIVIEEIPQEEVPVPTSSDPTLPTEDNLDIKEENQNIIDDASKEGTNDDFLKEVVKFFMNENSNKNEDEVPDTTLEEHDKEKRENEETKVIKDKEEIVKSVSSGNADIDYTGLLGDIVGNQQTIIDNQQYLISVSDDNNINSALNSQSCTNVLLMIVIVILLADILVHFIRGLF